MTPPPAPVDTPYAAPAQVAPTDDRAQLQAQLKDLKQRHRSVQQQVLFAVSSPVFEF